MAAGHRHEPDDNRLRDSCWASRQPRQGRGNAADFLAQLPKPIGVLVGGDVGHPQRQSNIRRCNRQRCRALRLVGIDDQLDQAIVNSRGNGVEKVRHGRYHSGIASVGDIASNLARERVHGIAAICVQLDPHCRRGGLHFDPS
jgi:hypothetical protein